MPNVQTVTITAGIPTAGTGTVSTLDNLPNLTLGSTTITGTVAVTQSGAWSLSANQSVNFAQINGVTPLMGNGATGAGSPRVTIASDNTPFSMNAIQSGTWTVQPGNTANTTAWKMQLYDGTTALPILPGSSGAPAASAPALAVSIRDVNANVQGGAPVTVGAVVPTATANGATQSRVNAAASTNATSLKASAGQIYSIDVFNTAAYTVFLKLYNKASAPTVGTDIPVWTIPIAAGGGYAREFPRGKTFATGIAYAITKLQADSDTTVVVAGDLTGSMDWM